MKHLRLITICLLLASAFAACSKGSDNGNSNPPPTPPASLKMSSLAVNGIASKTVYYDVPVSPTIRFVFSAPVDRTTVASAVSLKQSSGTAVSFDVSYGNTDSIVIIEPSQSLTHLAEYNLSVSNKLKSAAGGSFTSPAEVSIITSIDSSDKFPLISDEALLDLVQKQTFKYFWDFGHPVSGLARERNTSGDLVTSGGSGFGIMAIVTAVHRGFITRGEGLERMKKIAGFLKNKAQTFHGAFPHWLNGATGEEIAFSEKDDGGDLVETAFLMQGLITARQYFNNASADETALRNTINEIWRGVEWDWYRKNGENVLYWHWSPTYNWEMNHQIKGWNEALIVYALAASSPSFPVPKVVYDNGWASNGGIQNNNTYYNVKLPLGPALGGPLFFSHYSFLGINPENLSDAYANYWEQNTAHALINYNYAVANPRNFYGYSESVWGLTASDNNVNGYSAHAPDNDLGVITPTAALSSFPYTPEQSMRALKFFYYKLGDKIWKEYGFVDAFNLTDLWFADSFLAIDQGPIIVMIENYRSGLLWDLFMSAPEIKTGLTKLGFQSPNL
jgi:hypothetical protein